MKKHFLLLMAPLIFFFAKTPDSYKYYKLTSKNGGVVYDAYFILSQQQKKIKFLYVEGNSVHVINGNGKENVKKIKPGTPIDQILISESNFTGARMRSGEYQMNCSAVVEGYARRNLGRVTTVDTHCLMAQCEYLNCALRACSNGELNEADRVMQASCSGSITTREYVPNENKQASSNRN